MSAGRAHGKVILLGEHATVYGAPALAVGLDRGARASADRSEGPTSELELGGRTIAPRDEGDDDIARAFAELVRDVDAQVRVSAECELPAGGGLGSSAALGVAIARAVTALELGRADDAVALARATAWEKVFHGNPSGVDVAVAACGGCIRFSKTEGVRGVVPPDALWLAIGSSGVGSSTRTMVEGVARLRSRKPAIVDKAVEGIRALVDNAVSAVEAGDLQALGKLMDLNHMVLAGLMVSTETLEELCNRAREAGALGAKLTGAGGGGAVVALTVDREGAEGVVEAWRVAGFSGFATSIPGAEP